MTIDGVYFKLYNAQIYSNENYEKYKNGIDVYLECYCAPLRCHGDIIKEKLQKRLIKERLKMYKQV